MSESKHVNNRAATDESLPLCDRRILLVEDNVLIAMDIEYSLEDAGAQVVGPVGELAAGMNLAESEAIDGAVLDVDLAGEDVFPLADILEERSIPYLFHTGHGDRTDLKATYPNATVCLKPCPMSDLVAEISALVPEAR